MIEFELAGPDRGFLKAVIYGASGSGKCIENAYLLTDKGFELINDIGQDKVDGLSSYIGNLSLSEGKEVQTSAFWKEEVQGVVKITTRHGYELKGTSNHPILTWTPECKFVFKRLKDLKMGDIAAIARGTSKFAMKSYVFSKETLKQDNKNGRKMVNFPDAMTEELALILGYFVADGNFSSKMLHFSNNSKWFGKRFKQWASSLNVSPVKQASGWAIGSMNLKEIFQRVFNSPKKFTARIKYIPECILQASKEIQVAFLRGLIDCDSSYSVKTNSLEYCTASDMLHMQVKLMLLNLGIITSTGIKKDVKLKGKIYNHTYYRLCFYGLEIDLYSKIVGSDKYTFIQSSGCRNSEVDSIPFLPIQLKKDIKKWKKKLGWKRNGQINIAPGRFPLLNTSYLRKSNKMSFGFIQKMLIKLKPLNLDLSRYQAILDSGYHFDPIKSIEVKEEETTVYDVHVPDSHAFWSNGFISHNTLTSLILATAIGKTIIIDSESKAGGYASREDMPRESDLPPFYVKRTASITETIKIIQEIKVFNKNAKKNGVEPFKCLIIDSATLIYGSCSDMVLEKERQKGSKMYADWVNNGNPSIGAWKKIKAPWRLLEKALINMNINIFMTCRLKTDFDMVAHKIISESPQIEKDTPYAYSLLIKMQRVAGGQVYAIIENDVSWCIAGKKYINPDVSMIEPILARLAPVHIPMPEGIEVKENVVKSIIPAAAGGTSINNNSKAATPLLITKNQIDVILKFVKTKGEPGLLDIVTTKLEELKKVTSKQAGVLIDQSMHGNFSYFTSKKGG